MKVRCAILSVTTPREAGVRSLDREIAKICRKVVMQVTLNEDKKKASKSKQ